MKIRASIGTAAALGLEKIRSSISPTTAYLMMYTNEHCVSNCSFCPQARESTSGNEKLSRILWPVYDLDDILKRLTKSNSDLKRICIQTINHQNSVEQLLAILSRMQQLKVNIPISVCSCPVEKDVFVKMKELGVSRVGISFDCATPTIFNEVKGINRGPTLSWAILEETIQDAIDVFGERFVSTHLIIGLRESEKEAIKFIQEFHYRNITIALFAFTPIKGTDLENHPKPSINAYRRIQLARYLIVNDISSIHKMLFTETIFEERIIEFGIKKKQLIEIINSGKPFQTTGCPHCNRPFYNESPGKELYNFPIPPSKNEIDEIKNNLKEFL